MGKRRIITTDGSYELAGDLRAGAAETLRVDLLEKLSTGDLKIKTSNALSVDASIAQVMISAQRTALSLGREISFIIEDGTPFASLAECLALKSALMPTSSE